MVITKWMTVSDIVSTWKCTAQVLKQWNVPLSSHIALKEHIQGEELVHILQAMNESADSFSVTCQEGA